MTKTLKLQKILCRVDVVKQLQKDYNVTRVCVYNALAYRSNSELAKTIRLDALEKYDAVEVKMPTLV